MSWHSLYERIWRTESFFSKEEYSSGFQAATRASCPSSSFFKRMVIPWHTTTGVVFTFMSSMTLHGSMNQAIPYMLVDQLHCNNCCMNLHCQTSRIEQVTTSFSSCEDHLPNNESVHSPSLRTESYDWCMCWNHTFVTRDSTINTTGFILISIVAITHIYLYYTQWIPRVPSYQHLKVRLSVQQVPCAPQSHRMSDTTTVSILVHWSYIDVY